jgi:hypothetical protein
MNNANFLINRKSLRITIQELKKGAIHRFYNDKCVVDLHYSNEKKNYCISTNGSPIHSPTMIYARQLVNRLISQLDLNKHDKL